MLLAPPRSNVICSRDSKKLIVNGFSKQSKREVAIKIISKLGMRTAEVERNRDIISMYHIAEHHNVVRLEDYFEDRERFYLCLELHSKQTLHGYINATDRKLEESQARELCLKIARALEYLHENGIILKNLEAKGILMTEAAISSHLDTSVPRISNLDRAHVMGYENHTRGNYGDQRFRAPEVLRNKPYNFKADSWSFGIIIFFLLAGRLPFDNDTY
jgi:serine/threonine protein kinase